MINARGAIKSLAVVTKNRAFLQRTKKRKSEKYSTGVSEFTLR